MNGVIWSKMRKTFVPISSVPVYAMLQQDRLRQSREREIHNFRLQDLNLTSFQEPNFFEFYDNNTKITGICGELWTILSESLNFTLRPIKSNETSMGMMDKNVYFPRGLLDVIFRNKTTAIPKVETYSVRLVNCDFTIPLWISSQRMYIKLESIHDSTWMAKVFSREIWYIILAMYVLLSVCSFLSQIILARIGDKWKRTTFKDHFFYNFGMLCNQNYIPKTLEGRSRILEISLSLFCFTIYMAFGTVLFIYLSKRVFVLPFDTFASLLANTKYKALVVNGSIAHIGFQASNDTNSEKTRNTNRIVIASTSEEMYKMVCHPGKEKYIISDSEEGYLTKGETNMCPLIPTEISYAHMWIASCIAKNFKHKRTIDLGILKLMEVGLWQLLKNRWLSEKTKHDDNDEVMEAITMDQVSLIIAVMYYGMIIALIIFIIEKIVHTYKLKK